VWDTATGEEVFSKDVEIRAWDGMLIFSPDGRQIAGADGDYLNVWDAETGELDYATGLVGSQSDGALSPDGKRIAGVDGRVLTISDAETGDVILEKDTGVTKYQNEKILSQELIYSPAGKRIAWIYGRIVDAVWLGGLKVWDARTGNVMVSIDVDMRCWDGFSFSPDGQRIAGAVGGRLKIWNVATGHEVSSTSQGRLICFSPDGKRIAAAGFGGTVSVFDTLTGQRTLELRGHSMTVRSVTFSPDGRRLASTDRSGTVRVWDAGKAHPPKSAE
jgi:WD40 repeat protein